MPPVRYPAAGTPLQQQGTNTRIPGYDISLPYKCTSVDALDVCCFSVFPFIIFRSPSDNVPGLKINHVSVFSSSYDCNMQYYCVSRERGGLRAGDSCRSTTLGRRIPPSMQRAVGLPHETTPTRAHQANFDYTILFCCTLRTKTKNTPASLKTVGAGDCTTPPMHVSAGREKLRGRAAWQQSRNRLIGGRKGIKWLEDNRFLPNHHALLNKQFLHNPPG